MDRYGTPGIFNTDPPGSQFTRFAFIGSLQAAGAWTISSSRGCAVRSNTRRSIFTRSPTASLSGAQQEPQLAEASKQFPRPCVVCSLSMILHFPKHYRGPLLGGRTTSMTRSVHDSEPCSSYRPTRCQFLVGARRWRHPWYGCLSSRRLSRKRGTRTAPATKPPTCAQNATPPPWAPTDAKPLNS